MKEDFASAVFAKIIVLELKSKFTSSKKDRIEELVVGQDLAQNKSDAAQVSAFTVPSNDQSANQEPVPQEFKSAVSVAETENEKGK